MSDDDLEKERLETEVQVEQLKRELRTLRAAAGTQRLDPIEAKRRQDFQQHLSDEVATRMQMLGLDEPIHIGRARFISDWVVTHWNSRLREYDHLTGMPLQLTDQALKAMYQQDYESAEIVAEVRELRFNTPMAGYAGTWSLPVLKRAPELRSERHQQMVQKLFTKVSVAFTVVAAVFMFSMLVIGSLELGRAVLQGLVVPGELIKIFTNGLSVGHEIHGGPETTNQHAFLVTSLTALEIILVAPLPYLLVLALNRYIRALAYQEGTEEFRRELLEFKAFEVALFIAIIAASAVSAVLNDKFTLEIAAPTTLIIAILAAYYFVIERASKEAATEEREAKAMHADQPTRGT